MSSVAAEKLSLVARYFSLQVYDTASNDQELSELYALRYQVYCMERGFLRATDYPDCLERDAEDRRSAHFAARNTDGDVVGTARLVLSGEGEAFPFEKHCPAFPDFTPPSGALAAEVSRLAVSKNYRRRSGDTFYGVNEAEVKRPPETHQPDSPHRRANAPLLVLGLYREMYRYSCDHGIRYWYAAMERSLMRVLALYGFKFTPIGQEQDYYGPVTPYIGDIAAIEQQLEESNPDLLWWFRHGP